MNLTVQGAVRGVMALALDSGLFVSRFTAYAPSGILTDSGAPDGTWAAVAGIQALPCMAAPISTSRLSATETKGMAAVLATNVSHVLLPRYLPQLGSHTDWQADIDGTRYDILGAESDSQAQMTRVAVRTANL